MIVMVVPVRIFHRTRFNSHAIASPRHDQNLINWPGFEEFASEAVYFPLAATASAFPFQPFPQHSQHVNHKSVWWAWAGKPGGQLVTRLHTNYRCKSHLIENNLKWYRHWQGASRRLRWNSFQSSRILLAFNATSPAFCTQRACAGFIAFTCKMFVFGAHKRYKPNCFSSIGNSRSISFHLPAKSVQELRSASRTLARAHRKMAYLASKFNSKIMVA